jgi:spermidine/putrescine transport system substrate-binding protein
MTISRKLLILSLLLGAWITSCTRSCSDLGTGQDHEPEVEKKINLFIWGDYTSKAIFSEFERQTGIKVVESNFSSNEELLAKLQAGADGYDLIIPSDYMVTVMRQLDLLEPLNKANIPNANNIDPKLMSKAFDPDNTYSLPYSWAVTGIVFNQKKVHPPITGYSNLFLRDDIKYRIGLLDDSREVIGSVLKSMGQSVNTTADTELHAAKTALIKLKRNVREFTSYPTSMLMQGDLLAAQIYSNEALRLIQAKPEFKFVLPEEGFTISIDNLAIPRKAKRKANSLQLINFLLGEDVNLQFAQELLCPPVVRNGTARLPESMQSQPSIGQFDLIQTKGEMLKDLGPVIQKYDRIWTEVKASPI